MLFRDDQPGKPTGRLKYRVYCKGELIEEVDDENMIVVGYQTMAAHLLAGAVTGQSITTFGVGSSSTAAAFGNTTLTQPWFFNPVLTPTYPATNEVSFGFALGVNDANNIAISEFGLQTADPTKGASILYARRTRTTPLNKNTDITLSGVWVITFPGS